MMDVEEYLMDFESKGEQAQFSHLDFEDIPSDCTTISASEITSDEDNDTTPPLLCELKKVRVMIKKLPKNVLKKYKITGKTSQKLVTQSSQTLQPSRTSRRIRGKRIPVGQYLALHKNKPLKAIMNKQKLQGLKEFQISERKKTEKRKMLKQKNISSDYDSCSSSFNRAFNTKYPPPSMSKNIYQNKSSSVITTPISNKTNTQRNFHEQIAATRIINNKSFETPLPNFPDVVITRYDIPTTSRNLPSTNESIVKNPFSHKRWQNAETTSYPNKISYRKLSQTRNVQSRAFPPYIPSAYPAKQNPQNVMPSNANIIASNDDGLPRHNQQTPRKFTIQAFKVPNDLSKTNKLVPVNSPKVFILNNSSLQIDTENITNSQNKITRPVEKQREKKNTLNNRERIRVKSDAYLQQPDPEKEIEPEVIKRIVYHTKSVQTKFTCNSSICGLVDTDDFNLNCFYCYDIFPLHNWYEFKKHIQIVHQAEESANQKATDMPIDNAYPQENINPCMTSSSRYVPKNDKANFKRTVPNATEQVYKKLPLEPRLVAQRQNIMTMTKPAKPLSSTPKRAPKSPQIKNQSINSDNFSESSLPNVSFNNTPIDEVISLDSDDCDLDLGDLDDAGKSARISPQKENNVVNQKPDTHDVVKPVTEENIYLPNLPHITIKKYEKIVSPKAESEFQVPKPATAAPTMPAKEKFFKIPSTTNIQKVIRTLPKPTTNQLTEDGKTRPRYFVVKKIIKLPTSDQVKDLNIQKGMALTTMQLDAKTNNTYTTVSNYSTGKMEDTVPRPTNGVGILFGITNSMVVIEFLLKLKTFPELWRAGLKDNDPEKYNESVKQLCYHMNSRFNVNMTEDEILLSVQRVKDWYRHVLQSIHEHYNNPNKKVPYKHRFPLFFKILRQYLETDEIINKMKLNENLPQPPEVSSTTTSDIVPNSQTEDSQNPEVTADSSVIEFDADTLYDQESSDEEVLEEFDETSTFPKKPRKKLGFYKADGTPRSRTKIYRGSFECDICHKVYKRSCDLKRHKLHHLPPQFECGECHQKYYFQHKAERCSHAIKQVYEKYKKVDKSSGEKRIWPKKIFRYSMICEICGNSYRSIGSLNTHKKDKHFNQREKCVVCNFTALSNWRIIQHQRKRHIVEPGLPEDIARKSRARTDSKTTFSNEARQAFDWRREMRKTMNPGEKFFGCCRCKIIFNTRKEKVLHNKIEHPITEFTVLCLLCLPNKALLATGNSARRHYIVTHKVPWHEIDALVKSTKPIFHYLNKEEIELLKASENYKELLDELLKDKKLQTVESIKLSSRDDELSKAVENLTNKKEFDEEDCAKIEVESTQEEHVYVDGIIDHDHNAEQKQTGNMSLYEHDYSEEHIGNESYDDIDVEANNPSEDELYSQQVCEEVVMKTQVESGDNTIQNYIQNDQDHVQNITGYDFVEGELVEESIVVEEFIDEIIDENEQHFV